MNDNDEEHKKQLLSQGYRILEGSDVRGVIGRFFLALGVGLSREALKDFTNKEGFSEEYVSIGFKGDIEDFPDDKRLQKLDDKHVLIEQDSSNAFFEEDTDLGVDEIAWLDFPTFYRYVADEINDVVKRNLGSRDLLDLLVDLKKVLYEKNEKNILIDSRDVAGFIGTLVGMLQDKHELKKALANIAIKNGFGVEDILISFKDDLSEYDQNQIPKILDNKHVLLKNSSGADELAYAYLDFLTFYEYLAKEITKVVKAHPEEVVLLDSLAEIRMNLIINSTTESKQDEKLPQLRWCNDGLRYMGDQHIIENHAEAFAADGIPQEEIQALVEAAISPKNQLISDSEMGQQLHQSFEVMYQGRQHIVATTVAKNGYIISASPATDTANDNIKEIRLMLDYGCYPVWLYNENGELIANDLPEKWRSGKLNKTLRVLQAQYNSLFTNNDHEFKYNGFKNLRTERDFLHEFNAIYKKLETKSIWKYVVTNKVIGSHITEFSRERVANHPVTSNDQRETLEEEEQPKFVKKTMDKDLTRIRANYQSNHFDKSFDSMVAFVNHYQDQFWKYIDADYVEIMLDFKARDYIIGHTDKDLEHSFTVYQTQESSVADNCREVAGLINAMSSYVLDENCPNCQKGKLELGSSYDRRQLIKHCYKCAAAFINDKPVEINHVILPANKYQVTAYLESPRKAISRKRLRLDINQTYFAMAQWFESYYWASGDDSLGSLLSGVAIYRNDGIDELFDQGIADDWKKFYYSLGSRDHSLVEGFQAVNQFTNEYLPDIGYYTDLARNLGYATRSICEMSTIERQSHPVWQHWVASCEWIMNPNIIKVEESPFVGDDSPVEGNDQLESFPSAEVLPPARPVMGIGDEVKEISEMQNYFIMMDFLKQYDEIIPDNRDLKKIFSEFTLDCKTQSQKDHWYSWKTYFEDVSKKSNKVTPFQALAVASQFMQVEVPDNALHTRLCRQLTKDIWRTTFKLETDRECTLVWQKWMFSVDKILKADC